MTERGHETKRARVDDHHVEPLNRLARAWRTGPDEATRFVPWFDPDGPGVDARILLLLEAPGPATIARGDLGFSSLDNSDPTTRRLRAAADEAGVATATCLRWNIVPWALYGADGRSRGPKTADLEDARPALGQLLDELPHLAVVVPLGAAALEGWMRHLTLTEDARLLPTLAAPHPSPANGHRRDEAYQRTVQALRTAADLGR